MHILVARAMRGVSWQQSSRAALLLLLMIAAASPASATTVKILTSVAAGGISDGDGDDDLNAFYIDIGATSSLFSGAVTAGELAGVDLLVAMLPDDAFIPAEITAMDGFLMNGGRILFIGEQESFASVENGHVDAALSALGSTMSLDANSLDSGFRNTVISQIRPHPLNAGVFLINYGNVNTISGVPPGDELFLASNLTSVWGGVETNGSGDIVLLADVNIISHIEDIAGNDNHVFFANLAGIESISTAVKILTSTLAGTIANADGDNDLDGFYLDNGISSSLVPLPITAADLTDVRLLVVMVPDDAFTGDELASMGDYLTLGGRILFMGEQNGFAATENGFINSALAALGSTMSLGTSSIDSGLRDTMSGQILPQELNAGVFLVNYGNVNTTQGVPPDGELFLASDLTSLWGGVEELGSGMVILLGDLNMISNLEDTAANDNHIFFLNLLGPGTAGEAGFPAQPLEVTAFDPVTGNLSITYGPACQSVDHALHFGPLTSGDLATYNYTGADCNIGSSGGYTTFDPGTGSFFFVVVADDGTFEGSYGESFTTGVRVERPANALNPICPLPQSLIDRCD